VLTAHLAVTRLGLSGYWQTVITNCLVAKINIDTAAGFAQHRRFSEEQYVCPRFRRYLRNLAEIEGPLPSGGAVSGTSTRH
jgi:hypothetical protein